MALWVDIKYAGLLSPRLQRFRVRKQNPYEANFRCPVCGDSKKSTLKSRCWFYENEGRLTVKCYNCGMAFPFRKFLGFVDPGLEQEYAVESFKEGRNLYGEVTFSPVVQDVEVSGEKYTPVSELSKFHPARKYLRSRMVPKLALNIFGWTDDFTSFTNSYVPEKLDHKPEGRIIIPMRDRYGKMFGFQGRSLSPDGLRYISIMFQDRQKMFGLDRVDEEKKVRIVEGPIDSLFLDNGVAMAGADAVFPFRDQVVVYDNEPRNREIVARMERTVARGIPVVVWPKSFQFKDINDAVMGGMAKESMTPLIDDNTYQGLAARLKLSEWRMV